MIITNRLMQGWTLQEGRSISINRIGHPCSTTFRPSAHTSFMSTSFILHKCLSVYFVHFGIMDVLCRLQFPQLALRRRLGQLSCMSRPTVRLRSWPLSFLYYILPFGALKPLAKVGWRPTSRVSTGGKYKKSLLVDVVCIQMCKLSLSRDINAIHQCVISV